MHRRKFIKSGAVLSGAMMMPVSLMSNPNREKLKLGIVGTGWWGTDMLLNFAELSQQFEIIALCDINSVSLKNAAGILSSTYGREAKLFSSYEEMFELEGLDAVAIATPTHWHALQFIAACEKGLHVWIEKPVCYDIREGQAMLEAHRKAQNVVTSDFPRALADTGSKVKTLIKEGTIGEVLQVVANINNQEPFLVEKEIPETIDFDTFCGPAPLNKYMCQPHESKPHFRGIHDFSRGIMVDWGIHYMHEIRQVLDLDIPNSVGAIGGRTKNFTDDNPDHLEVRFDFNGLPVQWSHKTYGYTSLNPNRDIGVYYYGEKGTLFAGDLGWEITFNDGSPKQVLGSTKFDPFTTENRPIYAQMMLDEFNQFAEGIRKNSNAGITNHFERALKTSSCVTYGDLAYRAGCEIEIDPETMNITNNEAAGQLLKRDYRAPYKHPYN